MRVERTYGTPISFLWVLVCCFWGLGDLPAQHLHVTVQDSISLKLDGGFTSPWLFWSGSDFFVCDVNANKIHKFDRQGAWLATSEMDTLHKPRWRNWHGIAMAGGDIYLIFDAYSIYRFDQQLRMKGKVRLAMPLNLDLHDNDWVYSWQEMQGGKFVVSPVRGYSSGKDYEKRNRKTYGKGAVGVWAFDTTTTRNKLVKKLGSFDPELSKTLPTFRFNSQHLLAHDNQSFWMTSEWDHRVFRLNLDGDTLQTVGVPGEQVPAGFVNPLPNLRREGDSASWYGLQRMGYGKVFIDPARGWMFRHYWLPNPVQLSGLSAKSNAEQISQAYQDRRSFVQIFDLNAEGRRVGEFPLPKGTRILGFIGGKIALLQPMGMYPKEMRVVFLDVHAH